MTDALFTEAQRFKQPWIWLILIGISALSWWMFIQQVLLGRPFGDDPASDEGAIIIFIAFGLAFPLFMASLALRTEVDAEGIKVRFYPLTRTHMIPFSEISSCRIRRYSALREFGGWGIRYGASGKAYNVSGDMGLEMKLRDGGRLMIGTQRAEELESVIRLLVGEKIGGAAQI